MSESEDFLEILRNSLNEEQLLAATTTEGPVIVVAGAGAGKTRVLIHRIAYLLKKGVPPTSILGVTFTNKAAGEIRERLVDMVGDDANHVVTGTFHSTIFNIMKRYPESSYLRARGFDISEASILDESDSNKLFREAIKSLPEEDLDEIENNEWSVGKFKQILTVERAAGRDVSEYEARIAPGSKNEVMQRILVKIWRAYEKECRAVNAVDFDDILVLCSKMLEKEPYIAEALSKEFRYLMLDEYQDTNKVQMKIMDSIAKHHRNIFVVGDEKQSIYGFRGADISVILSFKKRYPEAVQVDMNRNYRSNPEVIRYSNACALHMQQKISDGQMKAMADIEPVSPKIVEFEDDRAEAEMVVRSIQRDLREGVPANEIAVLYRNKNQKNELERALVEKDVPYGVVNDTSFYQKAEVKDVIAMVRFVFQPWDSLSALRFLGSAKIGVSQEAAKRAMKHEGLSAFDFLRKKADERRKATKKGAEGEPTAAASKVTKLLNVVSLIKRSVEFGDPGDHVKEALAELWDICLKPGLANKVLKSNAPSARAAFDEKLMNVTHVIERVGSELDSGLTIKQIIEDLSFMVESVPRGRVSSEQVQLMTMHASKGLEYDSVYLVGVDNEACPVTDDLNESEESRRVFYVAMTRAKKRFSVSYATQRVRNGEVICVEPSPFIGELEKNLGIKKVVYKPQENTTAPGLNIN